MAENTMREGPVFETFVDWEVFVLTARGSSRRVVYLKNYFTDITNGASITG